MLIEKMLLCTMNLARFVVLVKHITRRALSAFAGYINSLILENSEFYTKSAEADLFEGRLSSIRASGLIGLPNRNALLYH